MITFLINRARRHWQVLSTVLLGVLISTVFLASGPIIVETVIDFALPYKLRSSLDENGIIYLSTYNNLGEIEHIQLNKSIQELLGENIEELGEIVNSSASPWLYPWEEGEVISDERINIHFLSGIEEKIEFSAGGWPEKPSIEKNKIQVIVPASMSEAYIIGVGDLLPVSKNNGDTQPAYSLEVAGVYLPKDAGDPYWFIEDNTFQSQINARYVAEYGVLVNEEHYYTTTDALFPGSNHQLKWLGIINPGQVNSKNLQGIIIGIEVIRENITTFNRKVVLDTNLDKFLDTYMSQSAEVIPPLYLLIGEVLVLGLYYVVMVAALSIRQVEGELSILASRGAEIKQLLRIQLFDASLICPNVFTIWLESLLSPISWTASRKPFSFSRLSLSNIKLSL